MSRGFEQLKICKAQARLSFCGMTCSVSKPCKPWELGLQGKTLQTEAAKKSKLKTQFFMCCEGIVRIQKTKTLSRTLNVFLFNPALVSLIRLLFMTSLTFICYWVHRLWFPNPSKYKLYWDKFNQILFIEMILSNGLYIEFFWENFGELNTIISRKQSSSMMKRIWSIGIWKGSERSPVIRGCSNSSGNVVRNSWRRARGDARNKPWYTRGSSCRCNLGGPLFDFFFHLFGFNSSQMVNLALFLGRER